MWPWPLQSAKEYWQAMNVLARDDLGFGFVLDKTFGIPLNLWPAQPWHSRILVWLRPLADLCIFRPAFRTRNLAGFSFLQFEIYEINIQLSIDHRICASEPARVISWLPLPCLICVVAQST